MLTAGKQVTFYTGRKLYAISPTSWRYLNVTSAKIYCSLSFCNGQWHNMHKWKLTSNAVKCLAPHFCWIRSLKFSSEPAQGKSKQASFTCDMHGSFPPRKQQPVRLFLTWFGRQNCFTENVLSLLVPFLIFKKSMLEKHKGSNQIGVSSRTLPDWQLEALDTRRMFHVSNILSWKLVEIRCF